jgi:2-succinyl-5-enolpyruvyl-6-hydroxy-3-cyclohexene-1-carboxylate synthase
VSEGTNARWSEVIAATLVARGVRDVVLSPGSRSTPLALAFRAHEGLRVTVIVDERSAAFVALGIAKAAQRPVALVCTSGSAAAHYLPAITEAWACGVALVAITADRPWELLGFGAPQTLPQPGIFGRFVVDDLALAEPSDTPFALRHLAALVARAVDRAVSAPGGPVHVNVPFAEPLVSRASSEAHAPPVAAPRFVPPARTIPVREVAALLEGAQRPLFLCGPAAPNPRLARALHALAAHVGAPVLAEAGSNARFGFEDAVGCYDAVLRRTDRRAAYAPDRVLRFGGGLTPKTTLGLGAEVFAVFAEGDRAPDPHHHATHVFEGAIAPLLEALLAEVPAAADVSWRSRWLDAERALRRALEGDTLEGEPRVANALVRALEPGGNLVLASSMPIRDVDAFAPVARGPLDVFVNRGVNGIDGLLSTAYGVALATGAPTTLFVGDVALLHDLGAWTALRAARVDVTVVVLNNDGGGIFHFLPVHDATPHFEELFGTPHGVDFAHAAAIAGAVFTRLDAASPTLEADLARSFGPGLRLVEVRAQRATNVDAHRRAFERMGDAVP